MASYEVNVNDAPDKLIAGHEVELLTTGVTLLMGQGVLKRGSVIGEITKAVGAPAADAGNTGDGTVTDVTLGAEAKLGNYKLVCTAAAANGGTFAVHDPDGNRLEDATVGQAYTSPQINFTINDGATDFIVGDEFTLPVEAGSGKGKLCDNASVDGSEVAKYILPEDVDTTAGDVTVACYKTGIFNRDALIFGGDDTPADHEAELRDVGIHLRDSISY